MTPWPPHFKQLLPKAVARDVPRLYAQDGAGREAVVHVKWFGGAATWFVTEADAVLADGSQVSLAKAVEEQWPPLDVLCFGLADLGMGFPELGYISLAEIADVKMPPLGLPIERDEWWSKNALGEAGREVGW